MTADGLELAMSAQDVGNAQESLDAKFEGTELTLPSTRYFCGRASRQSRPTRSALERSIHSARHVRAAGGDDFLYLLMPVRTS